MLPGGGGHGDLTDARKWLRSPLKVFLAVRGTTGDLPAQIFRALSSVQLSL